jgi:large subunit ribosomal protein L3
MSLGLIGYKVGMTQVFDRNGTVEPVTVIRLGPCRVLQIKYPTTETGVRKDGYSAVQLGFEDKPRKAATRPEQGHVAANLKSKRKEARLKAGVQLPPKPDCEPQRHIREFRLDKGGGFITKAECHAAEAKLTVERIQPNPDPADRLKQPCKSYTEELTLKVGQVLTVGDVFKDVLAVDVIGTTKGRGTQGVMKRHGFAGLPASHGAKKVHRQAGSTASLASNRGSGRPKKGLRRAGHYGNSRMTIRNLAVVKIDPENNLMLVRGGIPGYPGGVVMVRPTNKVGPGSPKAKTKRIEVAVGKKK